MPDDDQAAEVRQEFERRAADRRQADREAVDEALRIAGLDGPAPTIMPDTPANRTQITP